MALKWWRKTHSLPQRLIVTKMTNSILVNSLSKKMMIRLYKKNQIAIKSTLQRADMEWLQQIRMYKCCRMSTKKRRKNKTKYRISILTLWVSFKREKIIKLPSNNKKIQTIWSFNSKIVAKNLKRDGPRVRITLPTRATYHIRYQTCTTM